METEGTLIQLLKITERLSEQVEQLDRRMSKIEDVVNNDVRQDQRLNSIEMSLKRGNEKFNRIEERLNILEDADGNKAKTLLNKVASYLLTALLGFIAAAVAAYITHGGK